MVGGEVTTAPAGGNRQGRLSLEEATCPVSHHTASESLLSPDIPTASESRVPHDVVRQLEKELAVIHELEYDGYFLTMYEIVQFCRQQNILCQVTKNGGLDHLSRKAREQARSEGADDTERPEPASGEPEPDRIL